MFHQLLSTYLDHMLLFVTNKTCLMGNDMVCRRPYKYIGEVIEVIIRSREKLASIQEGQHIEKNCLLACKGYLPPAYKRFIVCLNELPGHV